MTHINNMEDPVPILPPLWLGYHHPSGEIHIENSGEWVNCPGKHACCCLAGSSLSPLHRCLGQDNPSSDCIVGSANLLHFNETNHDGPYDGIEMGC